MSPFREEQYVCKVCGYNMIGYYPETCPFCGALKVNFITAEDCNENYEVLETKVTDKVIRLNSSPPLGLEHSAYSIKTEKQIIWIDCPSTFSKDIERMDKIMLTHHHFLGASNLYRSYNSAFLWIHEEDSKQELAQKYPFDKKFENDYNFCEIEAFHINGHTPGFTFYIFKDVFFICDYVSVSGGNMHFNPYGPHDKTIAGANVMDNILNKHILRKVCGFDYVLDYSEWKAAFDILLNSVKI
ncbi:MAG: MBL fold metallo-hydrolase [Candidatus Lokiarchaeota archaeon]|nr:MBL fold metallo-hydrolase [Candidatus Lokiarchaeota archaeon]